MNHFITKLNEELNLQLQSIDFETDNLIEKSQKSFTCVTNALNQLKAFVFNYKFCNEKEEIQFFKKQKPELYSKSIYYKKIAEIESLRPIGCYEEQEIYLREELKMLTNFFNRHKDFYQYYRMESIHFDDIYFVRERSDFKQKMQGADIDNNFSTVHDYTVAKIIAYNQLEVFLNKELEKIRLNFQNPHVDHLGIFEKFSWTGSKISLYELIYSLCSSGVLNNGNCEINELTELFEKMFNICLDDIYRGFQDIKLRSNQTKFLDMLKEALLRKINEDYE
ncbi:MAG: RteC domain-containing protein [Paludibacter sp.]|nr:RteC domain-containing protein [Paludibacter sp.]